MRPLKISKNSQLLIGAVVLGVVTFFGANHFLQSYLAQQESRLADNYKTKKVIVAKKEVPAGGVLSEDNLAVRSIPARYLSSTTVEPDSLDLVSGQKIMVPLQPGDPIDRGALERSDRVPLSTTVAKGERAITFPVDEISSISGMLVPGDIIDLVFTGAGTTANSYRQRDASGPKELTHVRMILQAVPVMATGKTTQKRVVRTENGGQQEVNVDFSTVTLNVTPEQAEQVLLAQKLGSLTAVLRNPDDKTILGRRVIDETTFKTVEGPPPSAAGRYVEMIVGGVGSGAQRTQIAEGNPMLASVMPSGSAAARPAAPTQAPNAGDVKARLGLTPPPAPASTPTINIIRRN